MFAFSHILPLLWKIDVSHIFGIAWINAPHETCKKPIALECLSFPIRFPYHENSLFLHGFLFHLKYVRNWYVGIFVFSHNFSVLWEFTSPMFWKLYGFLLQTKYLRNTWPWNVLFSHTFQYYWKLLTPFLGDNTTDVKTNKIFLFLVPFPLKRFFETLH